MGETVVIVQTRAVHVMDLYDTVERAQKRSFTTSTHRLSGERNGSLS